MLYATGLSEQDMNKPQVGIASVWFEGNPCNMHLLHLADKVKEGVLAAGLVGLRFNTIGVSDGIAMGTDGMSFSLQSRDLIADSIETVMSAQWYDANISIPWMRQEYARMHHGHGQTESTLADDLRRHHSRGSSQRSEAGYSLGISKLWPISRPFDR